MLEEHVGTTDCISLTLIKGDGTIVNYSDAPEQTTNIDEDAMAKRLRILAKKILDGA